MQPAGWYVDDDNDRLERYWDGRKWRSATRLRQTGTVRFDEPVEEDDETHEELMQQYAKAQLAQVTRAANYLAVLAWIAVVTTVLGVAAGVIGAILASR